MDVITTSGLTKTFGAKRAVDDASIAVREGEIFGIIGKNGAGKTTLMKCILGLIPNYSGEIMLFGQKNLPAMRRKIGALLEDPGFFPEMTGRQNLSYYQKAYGAVGRDDVDGLLKKVGLYEARDKKYGKYSLGMKQRLGLALSLMGNPELLVLDEPINGIDPEGIVEIRALLKQLAKSEGKTILISSHILSELENTCDRFCIVSDGKVLEVLDREASARGKDAHTRRLHTSDDARAFSILTARGVECVERDALYLLSDAASSAVLPPLLAEGIEIYDWKVASQSLEDYYLHLVEKGGRR